MSNNNFWEKKQNLCVLLDIDLLSVARGTDFGESRACLGVDLCKTYFSLWGGISPSGRNTFEGERKGKKWLSVWRPAPNENDIYTT